MLAACPFGSSCCACRGGGGAAQVLENLGGFAEGFVGELLPVLVQYSTDAAPEVRQVTRPPTCDVRPFLAPPPVRPPRPPIMYT